MLLLQQCLVILILKVLNWHDFVSTEVGAHHFMSVQTVQAHESKTVKAVMDVRLDGLLTVTTSNTCAMTTLSNSEKT